MDATCSIVVLDLVKVAAAPSIRYRIISIAFGVPQGNFMSIITSSDVFVYRLVIVAFVFESYKPSGGNDSDDVVG